MVRYMCMAANSCYLVGVFVGKIDGSFMHLFLSELSHWSFQTSLQYFNYICWWKKSQAGNFEVDVVVFAYFYICLLYEICESIDIDLQCSLCWWWWVCCNMCVYEGSSEEGKWPNNHGPTFSESRKYFWEGNLFDSVVWMLRVTALYISRCSLFGCWWLKISVHLIFRFL